MIAKIRQYGARSMVMLTTGLVFAQVALADLTDAQVTTFTSGISFTNTGSAMVTVGVSIATVLVIGMAVGFILGMLRGRR